MQTTRVVQIQTNVTAICADLVRRDPSLQQRSVRPPIVCQLARPGKGMITAYSSGKVVIQGTDEGWMEEICTVLGGMETHEKGQRAQTDVGESQEARVGSDEAGKGDFFGPLVVCAVFVESGEMFDELRRLGVKDSKLISDDRAITLRQQITGLTAGCEVVVSPADYNREYPVVRNVNVLLAGKHAEAVSLLEKKVGKGRIPVVVIDQFSKDPGRINVAFAEKGLIMPVRQMHHGERDLAVATASICARGRFLLALREMEDRYDMEFPKGASHVIPAGKEFIARYGHGALGNVAKLSFKTAIAVQSSFNL
ncbi:MAG: ribonuclease HIII [Candidatus Dojkabacteria bacterium]|nr:ribonuclease HIII [Candidatus Dojkabacteria bacterium]